MLVITVDSVYFGTRVSHLCGFVLLITKHDPLVILPSNTTLDIYVGFH
jgi:hypothetical protein